MRKLGVLKRLSYNREKALTAAKGEKRDLHWMQVGSGAGCTERAGWRGRALWGTSWKATWASIGGAPHCGGLTMHLKSGRRDDGDSMKEGKKAPKCVEKQTLNSECGVAKVSSARSRVKFQ